MKGKFITFEGSEGCGKSTQARMLADYLRARGVPVLFLREPGGTQVSEKIRAILLDPKNKAMSAECETLLYMASRAEVVKRLILPALRLGKVIICDRFIDSTLVYQGDGLGVDKGLIKKIGDFACVGVKPDLTILLDLPVKDGLANRAGKKDRIEKRPLKYHLAVRRGYLVLARQEPWRIKLVRVLEDKHDTQARIRGIVGALIR